MQLVRDKASNTTNQSQRLLLLILFLLVIPSDTAHANVGTPLILVSFFHLVIGNAVIGVIEFFLIACIFGIRPCIALPIIIVVNYASMILGKAILPVAGHYFQELFLVEQPV